MTPQSKFVQARCHTKLDSPLLIREEFLRRLSVKYPALQNQVDSITSEQLISPFQIELPMDVLEQGKRFTELAHRLRTSETYLQRISDVSGTAAPPDPANFGLMMSYDYHLDSQGRLRLIEVNTNAAFLWLSELMYSAHELAPPLDNFSVSDLRTCFEREILLNQKGKIATRSGGNQSQRRAWIVDEQPRQQRLFVEFLVAQAEIRSWGWDCEIRESNLAEATAAPADIVYNRSTDFYLQSPEHSQLLELFESRRSCLSPNPHEYFAMADKQRLVDWQAPGFLESFEWSAKDREFFRNVLLKAIALSPDLGSKMWGERKKFFFKPMRSFGSKQSYRGESISRKAFEEMCQSHGLAQEFVPAPEFASPSPGKTETYKYDLRFYAYQGEVQSVVARVYQGQVVNLKTPWGGFAPVVFR